VRASFTVLDAIPADLSHGLFATPGRKDAWVRFSNSGKRPAPDTDGDGRGMAIKVLDVPGEKILPAERTATTQDFLLINHPVFFVGTAGQYEQFLRHDENDRPLDYFLNIARPSTWHLRGLDIARQIVTKKVTSPLEIAYFSMTPFRHGPENQAVKYRARPCTDETTPLARAPSPTYLRERMSTHLAARDACFVFEAQKQVDADRMPIEDATVLWREDRSPFVPLARIVIPVQTFESDAQMTFCENLSFTPWHALPAHRPLGGLNRIRRAVYEATSALRHEKNGVARREPDGSEVF
jgi:hypothetical protein